MNGFVVREGRRLGVNVAVNEALLLLVQAIEHVMDDKIASGWQTRVTRCAEPLKRDGAASGHDAVQRQSLRQTSFHRDRVRP